MTNSFHRGLLSARLRPNDHAFVLAFRVNYVYGPFQVLMVEPPLNERAQRQEMAAMMFETFKVKTSHQWDHAFYRDGMI